MDFAQHNYANSIAAFQHRQEYGDEPGEHAQHHYQQHYNQPSAVSLPEQHKSAYAHANIQQQMPCDIKPRLTKEQHDILEAHYQKQPKPNTSTKRSFAESLNVSLDKVNNWFQNRRAKSKQDAKKQQGALNLYNAQPTHQIGVSNSDSETSPAFASPDYFSMMQQCTPDDQMHNGLGIAQYNEFQEHGQTPMGALSVTPGIPSEDQFQGFNFSQPMPNDMFDSPQDLNRRTLTQDQFDLMQGSGDFTGFATNPDVLGKMFTDFSDADVKHQDAFHYPMDMGQPLSSDDSTIPSTISEHSSVSFPSTASVQDRAAMSSASSDWNDSRSSSLSNPPQREDQYPQQIPAPSAHSSATPSKWQPGQSVPVDFNQLTQEFLQASQSRQPSQPYQQEQPLAWPVDEAYQRRDSDASLITQSMGNVGINTPQPQQNATFKSPAPISSLAARRQKQRPAALGLASLRSQSYSGNVQPGSPGHMQQLQNLGTSQPLRRIKSHNMINGIANGRVQKSLVGPAQRSPLNWTFADAMNSPKAMRHASQSGSQLAPPTPMSPNEYPRPDAARHAQHWQRSSGHVGRQTSISESDYEMAAAMPPFSAAPPQHETFSSPPHTPMFHNNAQFLAQQQRINKPVITENTPPQSAPASQQYFPASGYAPPQQQLHQHQPVAQAPPPPPPTQQQMQHVFQMQPQQPMMNISIPEQQMQMAHMTMAPAPQFTITTSGPPMDLPMHFAPHGVPIVDNNGQLQMAMPSQMQFVPQPQQTPQPMHPSPPSAYYPYAGNNSPGIQITAQVPKSSPQQPATEFFVHEYSPPQDIKWATTPRKAIDTGPKSYVFANQGPEHFEKGKKGSGSKSSGTASSSPASATSS